MIYPDRKTAEAELELGGKMNPGPWTGHSHYTAQACALIAERVPSMDGEKAYILGLLHDIGRRAGIMKDAHMIEGYRYCADKGWTDSARICISHSFMIKDIDSTITPWDGTAEDLDFMAGYLKKTVYDDYDRLVQLCDSLAMADGFCILEKRFVDVYMRYGESPQFAPRWKVTYDIKAHFEGLIGQSIYGILPHIEVNTFR